MTDFSAPSLNKTQVSLPPLLQSIVELSMDQLEVGVLRLLDAVDDHFFDLAEEAKSNSEQNVYFEAMRDVRVGRRGVEQSFRQNIENGFRTMCFSIESGAQAVGAPPVLVDKSVGDLEDAVNRIDQKFKAVHSAELYTVTVRFDAISDDFQVLDANNALSPKNLCEYFNRASHLLSLDDKSRIVLFKLFDRNVIRVLPRLLQQVNASLAEAGVLPDISDQMSSSVNEESHPGERGKLGQRPGSSPEEDAEVFSHLQKLLENDPDTNEGIEEKPIASQGNVLTQQELLEILSSMQKNIPLPTDLDARISRVDIREQVRQVLTERQDHYEGGILSKEDEEVITLVEKLFNAILDDPDLADLVKTPLSRLQIPLVKLGLIDRSLFIEREHVGRALVNQLARLGGSDKNKSEMARNVLYTKVEEITQRIIRAFNEDVSVFESAYNDLMLFYKRTEARAGEMERRSRIASEGQEKVELARSIISQSVELLKKEKVIPPVVERLLNEGWSNLMLITLLKEGVPGNSRGDYLLTAEELIWSVQPDKDRAARQRLLQLVPHLIEKLKEGLTTINFEPFALSEILTELEQVHLAIFGMQREPIKAQESSSIGKPTFVTGNEEHQEAGAGVSSESITGDIASITRQIMNKSENSRLGVLDEDGAVLEKQPANASADLETPVSSKKAANAKQSVLERHEAEILVDQLNLGVWFEVHNQEADGKYRCKLAAHLTGYNKYIFVDRRGKKVMECNRSRLVDALVSAEMSVLKETHFFDRALQSVVSDLRNAKGTKS